MAHGVGRARGPPRRAVRTRALRCGRDAGRAPGTHAGPGGAPAARGGGLRVVALAQRHGGGHLTPEARLRRSGHAACCRGPVPGPAVTAAADRTGQVRGGHFV